MNRADRIRSLAYLGQMHTTGELKHGIQHSGGVESGDAALIISRAARIFKMIEDELNEEEEHGIKRH